MSDNINFQAQMFSTEVFSRDMRSLALTGDPYRGTSEGAAARRQLCELGVFFYRDQYHGEGVLLPTSDEVADVIGNRAFRYSCVFESDNQTFIRVLEWQNLPADLLEYRGDAYAWLLWGEACIVLEVKPDHVTCSI